MKKKYLAPSAEVMLFLPSESIATSNPWWWTWQWGEHTVPDGASANSSTLLIDEDNNPWDYSGKQLPY